MAYDKSIVNLRQNLGSQGACWSDYYSINNVINFPHEVAFPNEAINAPMVSNCSARSNVDSNHEYPK